MIGTVFADETALLQSIIELYVPGGFYLDPTFSRGLFYWKPARLGKPREATGIPVPPVRGDLSGPYILSGETPGGVEQEWTVLYMDARDLGQFECRSIPSIIFDPPFLHHHGKASKMGNRFSSYHNQAALHEMYRGALDEFKRVLVPGGILAFKCMDTVEASKQVMSHCLIWQAAVARGFKIEDLFILAKPGGRMKPHNTTTQQHARKTHCYWMVFRKGKD